MSALTPEMEVCLRRGRQHQKIADRWAQRLRDLHKAQAKTEPEKYVTFRLRWPAEQSQDDAPASRQKESA